jgi:hypothetical protein
LKGIMKKECILLCILCVLPLWLRAQQVSGRLIDEQQQPVEFANVVWLALPDSSFVQGTVTDAAGAFTLSTQGREGVLRISSVGYSTLYHAGTGSLGTLVLQPDAQLLGEVVVKSTLPKTRVKGDALVTNVEGTLLEQAGTLGNLLDRIPNVSSEGGSVAVFGRGEAEIYINGRKMRDTSELDQIAADNIKLVEVITNPGARYAAAVKAVVRITTKRAQGEGLGFTNRLLTDYDGHAFGPLEQINLNYRRGGLDLGGMGSYSVDHVKFGNRSVQTTYLDKTWTDAYHQQSDDRDDWISANAFANYLFNPDQAIGLRYAFQRQPRSHSEAMLDATLHEDDLLAENSLTEATASGNNYRHTVNAYYNGKLAQWTIDLNLDGLWSTSKSRVDERITVTDYLAGDAYQTPVDVNSRTRSSLYAGKLVVGHPLWQGELSLGTELDHTRRTNLYLNNVLFNSDTKVQESSQSVFAEYNRTLGHMELQLGLRWERVDFKYYEGGVKQDEQSRTFCDLFPTLTISAVVGQSQLQLSYRRDINRPSYSQLNSSVTYANRYSMQTGNPYLRPTLTDNLSVVWAWQWIQLYTALQHVKDDVFYSSELYTGGATDENAVSESAILIGLKNAQSYNKWVSSLTLAPTVGFWSPQLTASVVKQWLWVDTYRGHIGLTAPLGQFTFTNAFNLGHDFTATLKFNWNTKGYMNNLRITRNLWCANASLQKSWMKKRFTLRLDVYDIFKNWHRGNAYLTYTGEHDTTYSLHESSRSGRLSFVYRFNTARSKYRGTGAGESQKDRL